VAAPGWFRWLSSRLGNDNYWRLRAWRYGVRGALNLGHSADDVEIVTSQQKSHLFPLLRAQLNGSERDVLDFGCGPGRFTVDLADMVSGRAIGVDPVTQFIRLAPRGPRVDYLPMRQGRIPISSGTIDVVWICLVLGGIENGGPIDDTVAEIKRVLRPGGLVFLVENTTLAPDTKTWSFRSVVEYQNLFRPLNLRALGEYDDLGERITVMAGRSPCVC
jgi:SAM-dependent methyltransferase